MLGGSWLRFPWVDRRGIDQNSVKLLNYCLIICIMLNWVGARLLIRKRMNSHNFLLFKRQWLMIIQLIFDSGFQFGDVEKIISPNFLVIQSWSCWWIKITWEAAGFSPLRKDGVLTYQVPRRKRFVAFFFLNFEYILEKQTWNLKMDPWKRRNIYKSPVLGFHVCFPGSTGVLYLLDPPQSIHFLIINGGRY